MVISLSACFHHNKSSPLGGRCKYTGQSVRALPIRIITVGKKRSHGVQLVVDEYSEKLKYYSSVDCVRIRSNPKNAHDVKAQIEDEDLAVMCVIRSDDWVVILDEGGYDMSSELFAELIGDVGMTGASRLVFCIGGPYGHGKLLRERANKSLKLSSLTLNHQIALVVLMEQLYRSQVNRGGDRTRSRPPPDDEKSKSSLICMTTEESGCNNITLIGPVTHRLTQNPTSRRKRGPGSRGPTEASPSSGSNSCRNQSKKYNLIPSNDKRAIRDNQRLTKLAAAPNQLTS